MSRYDKSSEGFFTNLKRAFTEKDWLSVGALLAGILNVVLSLISVFTGFTKGWLSIGLGFVIAFLAMFALDKTKNNIALVGAVCGFMGTAIGLIYLFCMWI